MKFQRVVGLSAVEAAQRVDAFLHNQQAQRSERISPAHTRSVFRLDLRNGQHSVDVVLETECSAVGDESTRVILNLSTPWGFLFGQVRGYAFVAAGGCLLTLLVFFGTLSTAGSSGPSATLVFISLLPLILGAMVPLLPLALLTSELDRKWESLRLEFWRHVTAGVEERTATVIWAPRLVVPGGPALWSLVSAGAVLAIYLSGVDLPLRWLTIAALSTSGTYFALLSTDQTGILASLSRSPDWFRRTSEAVKPRTNEFVAIYSASFIFLGALLVRSLRSLTDGSEAQAIVLAVTALLLWVFIESLASGRSRYLRLVSMFHIALGFGVFTLAVVVYDLIVVASSWLAKVARKTPGGDLLASEELISSSSAHGASSAGRAALVEYAVRAAIWPLVTLAVASQWRHSLIVGAYLAPVAFAGWLLLRRTDQGAKLDPRLAGLAVALPGAAILAAALWPQLNPWHELLSELQSTLMPVDSANPSSPGDIVSDSINVELSELIDEVAFLFFAIGPFVYGASLLLLWPMTKAEFDQRATEWSIWRSIQDALVSGYYSFGLAAFLFLVHNSHNEVVMAYRQSQVVSEFPSNPVIESRLEWSPFLYSMVFLAGIGAVWSSRLPLIEAECRARFARKNTPVLVAYFLLVVAALVLIGVISMLSADSAHGRAAAILSSI